MPRPDYSVWGSHPEVGLSLADLPVEFLTPAPGGKSAHLNLVANVRNQLVYDQNARIADIPAENLNPIFPSPASYHFNQQSFNLTAAVKVVSAHRFKSEAGLLKTELARLLEPAFRGRTDYPSIELIEKEMPAEAYQLKVEHSRIKIAASDAAGIFYGIQSLKTMMMPAALAAFSKKYSPKGKYFEHLLEFLEAIEPSLITS
jgi:hexosaminidase